MDWYLKALKQYTDFKGRARRKEYWMFVLFYVIFAIYAVVIDDDRRLSVEGYGYGPIFGLFTITMIVPFLAVGVRRLHDIGKSGWTLLIGLIPLIGSIWLLALMVIDGDQTENEYGTTPKEINDLIKEIQPIMKLLRNAGLVSK